MKKTLLAAALIISVNAFAMDVQDYYDPATGELSTLITNPELGPNVPFSILSNRNGACIALGFEKSAPGAETTIGISGSAVTVNAKGDISGGTYGHYRLGNLVCVKSKF